MFMLNAAETRVLGALIEKEITTPEYYPLSLNALVNACNQKSSREPVMELSEADVRSACFELDGLDLVRTLADARVPKFEHRVYNALDLRRNEIAVLCLLLLRGPQTVAELRARSERLYAFDDAAAVTATLDRLAAREAPQEPLVRMLARQPGARESRWLHLLGGETVETMLEPAAQAPLRSGTEDGTLERLQALEVKVRTLEERLNALGG